MAKFDCNIYKDLIQRHSNLFLDESRKDVTFSFKGSDVKLKAHKMILETASPVFKSMFSGSFKEKDAVEIDDISPEIFELLLSGIYLNDIHSQVKSQIPSITYAELYYAAEKYDIKDIREIAKKFMIDNCNAANTNYLLGKAKMFNLPDLEANCKDTFQKRTYYVISCHLYLNLNNSYFHEFLDLDNLAINTEFDLYMALQAMVDNGKLLDYSKCLSKIRFLTIEATDILSCELLNDREKLAVMSNIQAKKFQKTPKLPMPVHLSVDNEPRKFLKVNKYNRQYFWTTLMLDSVNYEDYFGIFFEQMNISADLKEKTKRLIIEGRSKPDGARRVSYDLVHKTILDIFSSVQENA